MTIFPVNQLTGAKTRPSRQITWLVLVNEIEPQPSYNTIQIKQQLQTRHGAVVDETVLFDLDLDLWHFNFNI